MSDTVKIDLENLDDLKELMGDKRRVLRFDFQKVFAHLVLYWHWYLLSLAVCLGCAYFYLRYATPTYLVSARMLVKDEEKKVSNSAKQMLPNMEDFGIMNNSSGFENELEILVSPVTVHDAVKRLKLYTDYMVEGRFRKRNLYPHQPVCVDIDPVSLDSLDYYMLESTHSINMAITKRGEGYHATIELLSNGRVLKVYNENIDSLNTSLTTGFGILTFTANPLYKEDSRDPFQKGAPLIVTIRPPMVVRSTICAGSACSPPLSSPR